MSKTVKAQLKDIHGGQGCAVIVAILLAAVTIFFLQTWVIMILIGALHGSVSASVPALGFWASALVTIVLGVVGSFFKSRA